MNIQPNASIANVGEVTLYDHQTRLLTQTDPESPSAPSIDVATLKSGGSWDITVGPDHSGPQLKYLVADLYSDAAIVRTSVAIR